MGEFEQLALLAVGATASVFSVVDGVLLRPMPYPEPDRLAMLWQTKDSWFDSPNFQLRSFAERFPVSVPTFNDWTRASTGFESIGAPRVVLLSEGLWQERFGGADVLGRR